MAMPPKSSGGKGRTMEEAYVVQSDHGGGVLLVNFRVICIHLAITYIIQSMLGDALPCYRLDSLIRVLFCAPTCHKKGPLLEHTSTTPELSNSPHPATHNSWLIQWIIILLSYSQRISLFHVFPTFPAYLLPAYISYRLTQRQLSLLPLFLLLPLPLQPLICISLAANWPVNIPVRYVSH